MASVYFAPYFDHADNIWRGTFSAVCIVTRKPSKSEGPVNISQRTLFF